MKIAVTVIVIVLFNLCGNAQVKYFNRQYDIASDTANSEYYFGGLQAVVCLPDSGYFATGFSSLFGKGVGYYYIRTDENGDTLWHKRFKPDSIEGGASSVIALTTNTFLIAGDYIEHDIDNITRTNRDVFLMKLTGNGDTIWTKRYSLGTGTASNPDFEECRKVILTADGGFALACYSSNFAGGKYQVYLIKTDSSGNKQWDKNYGGSAHDAPYDILQLPDKGYFIFGWSDSYTSVRKWYLIRTDSLGNELWYKTYGENEYNVGSSIILAKDGNFLLNGGMYLSSTDLQSAIVKIDPLGNIIWQKKYGGIKEDGLVQVLELSDGSVIAAGSTKSYSADAKDDAWLIKTDPNGNLIWNRVYGKDNEYYDYFFDVKITYDGGFIACGQTRDTFPEYQNGWLVKVDCLGCDSVLCYYPDSCSKLISVNDLPGLQETSMFVYPNPFSEITNISYDLGLGNSKETNLIIYDVLGKIIMKKKLYQSKGNVELELRGIAPGIYQCVIVSENIIKAKTKLLKLK